MAVVDMNTNEWINPDGVKIKFGADQARVSRSGEYSSLYNGTHCTEVIIDLVDLSAKSTFGSDIDVILDDTVSIPGGALIEKVELVVTEVTAGSSATLDVGFYKLDGTVYDQDALIVGGTTTWHTGAIGTTVTYTQGSTEHGSSLGEVLTEAVLISAQVDGAAYTDGVVKIRVYWSIPLAADL